MRLHPTTTLTISLLTLVGTATGASLLDLPAQARQDERTLAYQRLVGGLGFGPALNLARCPFSFDPRLAGHCAENDGAVPGGERFCPHHACSLFHYAPLDGRPSDAENR